MSTNNSKFTRQPHTTTKELDNTYSKAEKIDDHTMEQILTFAWLENLEMLVTKYNELGTCYAAADLSLINKWRLYRYLLRHDHGE